MEDLHITRRQVLKGAAAAASVPLLGTLPAFAEDSDDEGRSRIFVFVAFSQAPAALGLAQPRMGMTGAGTFRPPARRVSGGGSYSLFDNASSVPRPLVSSGRWRARQFVSYDTKGLRSYGTIQPAILTMTADVEGIGENLTLEVVCNVGALGPAGSTGEEEGWELSGTGYGTFHQLSPALGISHLSVEGFTIGSLGRSEGD